MRRILGSGIFRRIVLSILLVSVVPLILLGALALLIGNEAGAVSIARSREALDERCAESLELRTIETANAVARFLEGREVDLLALSQVPRTSEAYLSFYEGRQGEIWFVEGGQEVRQHIPLYREIAYVDVSGQEVIKVSDGRVASRSGLRDVSDPANTLFKSETYFNEAKELPLGEIYVSHITGFYVSKAEFDAGERFRGVIRFAMPVFDGRGKFDGVIVLALDSRHLDEFTDHIVPTDERYRAMPSASDGNYAYMIDDLAQTVTHPNDFLQWGISKDGEALPYVTQPDHIGNLPVRLDMIGFMDENLASIPRLASSGEAGSIQYNWGGYDKFVSYAPIPYYGGAYEPPAGFGWVAIGAKVESFHGAATEVGQLIQDRVISLGFYTLGAVAITALLVLVVASVLARQISDPIQRLIEAARSVERNVFELEILSPLTSRRAEDEIGHLARVFEQMADQVKKREQIRRLLDVVISIGTSLAQEKDFNRMLETVVVEAQSLWHADGGTLYLRTADDQMRFVILRNDSLKIAMGGTTGEEITYPPIPLYEETGKPNHHNVVSHVVHTADMINIPDVYQAEGFDFSGTKKYDERAGYRSKSFLTIPLKDAGDEIIGVLQMINAQDPETGEIIPFDAGMSRVFESYAALGTVALKAYMREEQLRKQIEKLRIEVDEKRKAEQVAEITETIYFQDLRERIKELKQKPKEEGKK